MFRCLIAFITYSTTTERTTPLGHIETPTITGSIRSPFNSLESTQYQSIQQLNQLHSAHYGISSEMLTSCAHANLQVTGDYDLTMTTTTVSTQSVGARDRRCVLSSPLQKACLIDHINVPLDEKLHVIVRIHQSPTYSLPFLSTNGNGKKFNIPDVTDVRNLAIDAGSLIMEASLALNMHDLVWGTFCPSCSALLNDDGNSNASKQTFQRALQFENVHHQIKMNDFQTSYSCDETLSCHYQNVVLSDMNPNDRGESDLEEQVIWLFSNKHEHKTKVEPCTTIPVTTTVHKRFVTSIGWRQGERPAITMKSATTNNKGHDVLQRTAHHCIANPSILFTMPFPTYYYHAVAEGVIPLGNAIRNGYNGRRDVQLINLQRWGDFTLLPVFLQEMLATLSDLMPLTLEQLQLDEPDSIQSKTAALCFQEMSTGFWPTIRNRQDFAGATEMVQKNMFSSKTKPHVSYPRPPTPWQLGMFEQTNELKYGLPKLYIAQRTLVDNLNFDGQNKNKNNIKPTRVIKNINELSKTSTDLGYETKVVDLVGMSFQRQVKMMQEADVFVAVFGSAWANVVWMRRKGTASIMLLGWGFKDGCDFQMPTQTPVRLFAGICRKKIVNYINSTGGNESGARSRGTDFFYNDHCDSVLHEFPALVDPMNSYIEIVAKRPEQFEAPFFLDDWICQHDKDQFRQDYGVKTAANVAKCMKDHVHTHNKAIANPSWAWENAGINAAHLFFLNADLWIDTEEFENALVQVLPTLTRIPAMKSSNSLATTWANNVQAIKLVKTCWISIHPRSDSLVTILARSALSMLSLQKKMTAHVVDAKIRFTMFNAGYADDVKLELRLECEREREDGSQKIKEKIVVAGTMTLMSNEQGIPFWFPVSIESIDSTIQWKNQTSVPAWTDNCVMRNGGLLASVQHMMAASTLYKFPFQRLMVRLGKMSQHFGRGSRVAREDGGADVKNVKPAFWPVERTTVVIGVAVNYGMSEFRRFVGSLRSTTFPGTIILGVSENISPECIRYLKRHRVEIRLVTDGDLTPKKEDEDGVHSGFYNIALPRWILYQKWINEDLFSNTTRFLLTDTRDVYFQRDPFDDLKHDHASELYMFEEWENKTIGTCKHNSDWIRSCWGPSILDQLFHHPIICSGTILGSRKGITALVNALLMEAEHVKTLTHELNGKAKHGRPCINDQAYVNVLMRQHNDSTGTLAELKSYTKIFKQGDGPVNTIGWLAIDGVVSKDNDGFVLNNDGRRSAVVHQYDRDVDLQTWLDARFVFVLDPIHETWAAGNVYANAIRTAFDIDMNVNM